MSDTKQVLNKHLLKKKKLVEQTVPRISEYDARPSQILIYSGIWTSTHALLGPSSMLSSQSSHCMSADESTSWMQTCQEQGKM